MQEPTNVPFIDRCGFLWWEPAFYGSRCWKAAFRSLQRPVKRMWMRMYVAPVDWRVNVWLWLRSFSRRAQDYTQSRFWAAKMDSACCQPTFGLDANLCGTGENGESGSEGSTIGGSSCENMQQLVTRETVWIIYDGSTERNVALGIKDKVVLLKLKWLLITTLVHIL